MFISAMIMLLSCLLLGGATSYGYLSDVFLQLLAIPVLLFAVWHMMQSPPHRQAKLAIAFYAVLVLTPLLQLIPLPPGVWTMLPGRETVTAGMKLAFGELPWMPLSLSPRATWLSLLALLPFLAIFLSVQQLGFRDRRRLSIIIIAVALVSAFIGVLQVAQGPSSPLRFYDISHTSEAIGFFANRNHFAALLYSTIVIVVAWLLVKLNTPSNLKKSSGIDKSQLFSMLAGFIIIVALIAGLLMARSRAGLALAMVALVGIYLLGKVGRPPKPKTNKSVKLMWAAVALALVFAGQFALFRVMERVGQDLAGDVRPEYARQTVKAALSNMPTGTGLGSFVPVYKQFETTKSYRHTYANHAHNDYLQVWLEAGVIGLVLMVLFAFWYFFRTYQIWRHPHARGHEIDHLLARSATIIIGLVCLHSIVDYPLRTTAMMAVIAFAMALLIDPPAHALKQGNTEEFEESPLDKKNSPTRRKRSAPPLQPMPTQPIARQPAPQNRTPDKTPWEGIEWPKQWQKDDKGEG